MLGQSTNHITADSIFHSTANRRYDYYVLLSILQQSCGAYFDAAKQSNTCKTAPCLSTDRHLYTFLDLLIISTKAGKQNLKAHVQHQFTHTYTHTILMPYRQIIFTETLHLLNTPKLDKVHSRYPQLSNNIQFSKI